MTATKVYHQSIATGGSDNWTTPQTLFDELNQEFHFDVDAAALADNALCAHYFGPDHDTPSRRDALTADRWGDNITAFLNPPYSLVARFTAKAHDEARAGRVTTVMLVPARTDTRWFHAFLWDRKEYRPQAGIEIRFLKGRIKFGGSANGAPFPSMIVVLRAGQVS